MIVTATELKANVGRYLDAIAEEKQAALDSLVGITAASPVSLEEARKERLAQQ